MAERERLEAPRRKAPHGGGLVDDWPVVLEFGTIHP